MDSTLLLALMPLILIEFGLKIFALLDLAKRDKTRVQGGKKWVWVVVILFFSLLGSIVYLVIGRTEGEVSSRG